MRSLRDRHVLRACAMLRIAATLRVAATLCVASALRAAATLRVAQRYALYSVAVQRCRVLRTRVVQGLHHGAAVLHARSRVHGTAPGACHAVDTRAASRTGRPEGAPGGSARTY